ncbi:PLP-dependent aminotransferase family protein [Mycobacterium sp. TNTM28]|uniref:PLP-dependent aminotransferase family protein n=1 Tax=[Mycobacterium] fortunisiensis TaxID=2600579 RepID=A0ABS6KTZ1_9MYCO|nr:PLP-dependent aminotransferase family protein [[Mycobacterium] fortunisiensis]MBU9767115.1 PLP-dependent aminotransferase family protein [[Mycobacterium] fortunisiensis]
MATSGTNSGPELLVELDRGGSQPLHRQLADGLREAIRSGRLAPATRMPATRVLAADLGVSRRLVVEAYGQLTAEGFLHTRQGGGTHVAAVAPVTPSRAGTDATRARFDIDFAPGSPDLASFPRQAWLRAMRQGLAETESSTFGYVAPHGLAATRTAVADYLRRTRGVVADPRRIVLCSGATQAIALLARCLDNSVATEDPGFWPHRMVLRHNGIEPSPIPVDGDGIDVAALEASGATTILTTPAHQSPTGVVLSPARRTALLHWAQQPGRLIIEDDYDAEYRYDRSPVGALQGVAPDQVVYVGSTSKTLAPGLRIGWMVVPDHLIEPVRIAKGLADTGSSVMDQIAFSQFLTSGGYDRHLRQMRRRYPARRRALLDALSRHLPLAEVLGAAAGVHLTVRFPAGFPVDELIRRATARRIRLEPLAPCYADPDTAPPGLILGYANLTESQIARGVEKLGEIARQLPEV